MRRKPFKIFRRQLEDKNEVYFIFYSGLMCSGIVIFEETEKHENGIVFVEAKKIDCSYDDVLEKMKHLSITCVKEDKFIFEDVEFDGYKSVFHNYRKMGAVITASGYRILNYSSMPRVVSIVETYMPKNDFYHVVKNHEDIVSSDCLRDDKFYHFFLSYAKETEKTSKFEFFGKEYDFVWMNINRNNFCGALYFNGAFEKFISFSEYMNH